MLGDITAADEIYIVTGRTDMRKSIDGLCAIVEDQLHMDPSEVPCIFSVENVVTGSKLCSGNLTDLCCCINAWSPGQIPLAQKSVGSKTIDLAAIRLAHVRA